MSTGLGFFGVGRARRGCRFFPERGCCRFFPERGLVARGEGAFEFVFFVVDLGFAGVVPFDLQPKMSKRLSASTLFFLVSKVNSCNGFLESMSELVQVLKLLQQIEPGGSIRRSWSLAGGCSAQMMAYELVFPTGASKTFIIRRPGQSALARNPVAARDEFKILKSIHSSGLPVQTPYLLDESLKFFESPVLVLEYVEGEADFAPADLALFLQQFASQLAQIHRVPLFVGLPSQSHRLERFIFLEPEIYDDSIQEKHLREILRKAWPSMQQNQACLLHGDFWPGNVLWRDGVLVSVIDWEDAEAGDPLCDLAVSRLDMLWIFGEDAMRDFTELYLSEVELNVRMLPYWDLLAALRTAGALSDWSAIYPGLGRPDITEERMGERLRGFVASALKHISS